MASHCNSFAKFDGIDGQSTDQNHSGWCDLVGWSLGTANDLGSNAQIEQVGRGHHQTVKLLKVACKATPGIHAACSAGQDVKKLQLHSCQSLAGASKPTFEFTAEKCKIVKATMLQAGKGVDSSLLEHFDVPEDNEDVLELVEVAFDKGTWKKTPTKADGTTEGPVEKSFESSTNKGS